MKIFSAAQQHVLDQLCIASEPITSIDLMERASNAFCNLYETKISIADSVDIYCGNGNNAGDALAIARILFQKGFDIRVFLIPSNSYSEEFKTNLDRLKNVLPPTQFLSIEQINSNKTAKVAIDGIFGIGLNRSLDAQYAKICNFINHNYDNIVAIDIPSGMYADKLNGPEDCLVQATLCISFHAPKLCFFLDENGQWIKEWQVVDIGISKRLEIGINTSFYSPDVDFFERQILKRQKFSHKGTFGYGLLWAGSIGMYGAAILSAKAALRSGIGKITVFSNPIGHDCLQIGIPEAMFLSESDFSYFRPFSAIGIGPGLGKNTNFETKLGTLFELYSELPWVVDADAINMLSEHKHLLDKLPKKCILTPHPKELERLTGKIASNRLEQIENALAFCKEHNCVLVLKGAYSAICNSKGEVFFNPTGNPGMATAGSGDVLTGIILALLAQGYDTDKAALLGAYLHGKAGDIALELKNEMAIIATDIIENL